MPFRYFTYISLINSRVTPGALGRKNLRPQQELVEKNVKGVMSVEGKTGHTLHTCHNLKQMIHLWTVLGTFQGAFVTLYPNNAFLPIMASGGYLG